MIKENISTIKQQILKVCSKINQDAGKITIIAVSKGRTLEQIKEAIDAGINDIGENRVQEAFLKYNQLVGFRFSVLGSRRTPNTEHRTPIKWHMVGHLQTNKVKDAVKIFDLIQSVDSVRLAEAIDREAAKINKRQDILMEIKTSPEDGKFGLKPDDTLEVIKEIVKLKNVNIKGLMTIAPVVDNPEKTRPYFRMLKELRDKINKLSAVSCQLTALSMGMTDDYEVAIEEGANMLRLGRAIFE